MNDIISNLSIELKRGTYVIVVLTLLKESTYGYSLTIKLEEIGFPIDQNTLYPLMRRLEKQGLLKSDWNTDESRPRKYYIITKLGLEVLEELINMWKNQERDMLKLLGGKNE
jgi:DNA-binding PadR family transcriptional regulator